jgi:hypothetical protein
MKMLSTFSIFSQPTGCKKLTTLFGKRTGNNCEEIIVHKQVKVEIKKLAGGNG